MAEAKYLNVEPNMWLGYNAFNEILHTKFVKSFDVQKTFDAKVFEEDFLTWLDMSIADVSDIIIVCITPLTATISANAVINYKDY